MRWNVSNTDAGCVLKKNKNFLQRLLYSTTVRLNVEENQLVNVFGEFCVCVGSLKSA